MFLFAHCVSFPQPCDYFSVHIRWSLDAKVMYVIARRERFDFVKARMLDAARQDNMRVQAVFRQAVYGSEDHARLYTNPGFNRRETDLAKG